MKLTYETSVATFIQFIVVSLFILFSQLGSSAVGCFKNSNDCVTNLITSIIFFILVAVAFGVIWVIGYTAQERRSRRLAQFVICIEGFVGLIALFSIKLNLHSGGISGLVGSIGMLAFTGWIIVLAFRLMRADGGRIVTHQRPRHRRPPTS